MITAGGFTPAAKGKSPYGYDQIVSLINQIRPQIVFLLYDIPFQVPYINELRQASSPQKIFARELAS